MKKHVLFCIIVFLLAAVNTISLGENYPLNASGTANLPLNVNPAGKTEGYSAIVYNNPNGLPTSEANAIAETSEGFIWIGSYAGLTRDVNKTVQVGLRRFVQENSSDYHLIMAASLCSLLPVSVVFLCLQRYFIEGIATSGLKG